MTQPWFLDTGFVIALVSTRDRFHPTASRLSGRIESEGITLVTSQAVLLEIGSALSRLAFRPAAVRLIESLRDDPAIEIVPLTDTLMQRSFATFKAHGDKEWSLTDCISIEIMRERELSMALTPDHHFAQAGLTVLMQDA